MNTSGEGTLKWMESGRTKEEYMESKDGRGGASTGIDDAMRSLILKKGDQAASCATIADLVNKA